jgi:hypothetical protein
LILQEHQHQSRCSHAHYDDPEDPDKHISFEAGHDEDDDKDEEQDPHDNRNERTFLFEKIDPPPDDKWYNLAYCIFFLLGIGSLVAIALLERLYITAILGVLPAPVLWDGLLCEPL